MTSICYSGRRYRVDCTPDQRQFLLDNYVQLGLKACAKHLGWGVNKTRATGAHLGLHGRVKWDPKDLQYAVHSAGDYEFDTLAKKLGRSGHALVYGLDKMGFRLGCPQGFEYLSVAAARLGYKNCQLRTILKWANVPVRPSFSRPGDNGRRHIVESHAATEAVENWCAMHTFASAAAELGVSDHAIRTWTHGDPRLTRAGSLWRVPPEVMDELRQRATAMKQRRKS